MSAPKSITLALQGGGAYGAFTWGVLDRLLEDKDLRITGMSGTSAGAMNAAVLVDGFEKGGPDGAKNALHDFWRAMSDSGSFVPYQSRFFESPWGGWSSMAIWLKTITTFASPHQFNPLDVNPLKKVLEETIDYERLRDCESIKLFISATNVRTNRLKIFTGRDMSPDVLLASACLRELYRAVEINGDAYWDGGLMGNPTLEPLLRTCQSSDLIIVLLNPTRRATIPQTPVDIAERRQEITLNSSLMREIRSIAHINRVVERGALSTSDLASIHMHEISAQEVTGLVNSANKFNTSWAFLTDLRDEGRNHADAWLGQNKRHLAKKTTLTLSDWEDYVDY